MCPCYAPRSGPPRSRQLEEEMEAVNEEWRHCRFLAAAAATTLVILVGFSASILARNWPDILFKTDFVAFWTGASLIRQGAGPGLFDIEVQKTFQDELRLEVATPGNTRRFGVHMPFISPPPLALFVLPLTPFPMPLAYLLWLGVSLAAFVAAIAIPLRSHPSRRELAVVLLSYMAVMTTLVEGQVNAPLLLALSLALWALGSGRPLLGGALFGLLWLKPQYAALFLTVFLVKGRWRELAGMVLAGAAVAGLSWVMVGSAGIAQYLAMLPRISAFHPQDSVFDTIYPEGMVNWRGLLVNVWPTIPAHIGSTLVAILGGATALASLLAWRGEWEPGSPRFARQMTATALATLAASPHSHFHGTALLLPFLALAMARSVAPDPYKWVWRATMAIGYVATFLVLQDTSAWLLAPFFLVAMALLILSVSPAGASECDGPRCCPSPQEP